MGAGEADYNKNLFLEFALMCSKMLTLVFCEPSNLIPNSPNCGSPVLRVPRGRWDPDLLH